MEIMIPAWPEGVEATAAVSQLRELKGASVAFVDDGYDEAFSDEVYRVLTEDFGAEVVRFPKPHGSKPSPEALIAEAAKCKVAVVGIAL